MGLFLQIVGGIVLALVVLAVVGFYWLKWKLKRAVGELGEAFAEVLQNGPLPSRVQLERADDLEWKDEVEIAATADALRALGYRECGAFRHSILPVLGFAHEELSIYALVSEHPQDGPFVELASGYADDRWLTVSTCPDPGLDRPEHMPIERFVDTPVENLHQILLDRRGPGPYRATPVDGYVNAVAAYGDEELLWRAARGGPTESEIRRVAAMSGQAVTDDTVTQTRERMRASQAWEVDEALRDRFLESSTLGAKQWDAVREDIVFVHDGLSPDELVERLEGELDCEDEDAADRYFEEARRSAAASTARRAFAQLKERVPGDQRFELVGTVDGALPADVYRNVSGASLLH